MGELEGFVVADITILFLTFFISLTFLLFLLQT